MGQGDGSCRVHKWGSRGGGLGVLAVIGWGSRGWWGRVQGVVGYGFESGGCLGDSGSSGGRFGAGVSGETRTGGSEGLEVVGCHSIDLLPKLWLFQHLLLKFLASVCLCLLKYNVLFPC